MRHKPLDNWSDLMVNFLFPGNKAQAAHALLDKGETVGVHFSY